MKSTLLLFLLSGAVLKGCVKPESTDNIEPVTLESIDARAQKIPNLRSLIISRNEEILHEKYYKSYSSDSLDHVRSVTKSVMSILTGIALDQGIIPSLDQTIDIYFGDRYPEHLAKLEKITIRHLLTMSGGFRWDESTVSEFNNWVVASDPVAHVLKRNLVETPGEVFEYNSGLPHMLSVILTKASGMSTLEFANTYLFEPLDISVRWQKRRGYYNGGAELEFKPRDMLKIGQLMLNEGRWNGVQIISKEWVSQSTDWQIPVFKSQGYGFLWWMSKDEERNAVAIGYAGQFIILLPDRNAVITVTCNWQSLGKGQFAVNEEKVATMVKEVILPYLKGLDESDEK